jgi:hypothetical protein
LKAAFYGRIDLVRELLQKGVGVDLVYGNGYETTALMIGIIVYF